MNKSCERTVKMRNWKLKTGHRDCPCASQGLPTISLNSYHFFGPGYSDFINQHCYPAYTSQGRPQHAYRTCPCCHGIVAEPKPNVRYS